MKIYEPIEGMYQYQYLPAFARFVLDHCLEDYVQYQLSLSRLIKLPMLKHFAQFTDEQLLNLTRQTSKQYLQYLALNQAKEQMEDALQRWVTDQLEVVAKASIEAEDITAIQYIRSKSLKKCIHQYPLDTTAKWMLMEEIDTLQLGAVTSSTHTYIELLKNKISDESHLNDQLINTSPGIIFIFDLIGQQEVYINGNVKGVMGYTPEEIIDLGNNLIPSLTHPDDLSKLISHIQEILNDQEEKTHILEYRFKHKDGTYRWLRSYDTVFKRDEQGRPTQLLGTTFEITAEKNTALALKKREEQLLEAQSIAHLGSFDWDIINDHSDNTPELIKIFEIGTERHEDFMNHVHPQDKEKIKQCMDESFTTGRYDCQFRYQAKTQEKVLWARGVVYFNKDGRPISMRGTVQDITTLKNIENELMQKTRALEQSNESLQQFASIASHDLKEPLRKMSMYSDMVIMSEEGRLSETSLSNLKKVKKSSLRMQSMIEDILNFSSITKESNRQRISLKNLIDEACEILQVSIEEKGAAITYHDLPDINVIPTQIRQMFQNLIGNALKFSRPGVKCMIKITHRFARPEEVVSLSPEPADQYLQIFIQDNGIGFKQEQAEKIFGLFTRLHSRAAFEGSGLGLSICKKIAENHGGVIHAVSQPEKGSTFIVTLPVR